jgi:hypothetical protein
MPKPKKNRARRPAMAYYELTAKALRRTDSKKTVSPVATTHTLFCDETGNSGRRFYCPEQPLYAEGGWLVSKEAVPALTESFFEVERDFKFTPKTKGTKLKDSSRGRECIATALRAVSERATPFFYVVEKRYFICAKAVECFYDPSYNPEIDPRETHFKKIRAGRADLLYSAPDEVLSAFAEAYRRKDAPVVAECAARWVAFIEAEGAHEMARQLAGCLPTIREDMEREFAGLEAMGLPKGYDSLNTPSLSQALQLIEAQCPACDIVHDQCDTMAAVYRFFFERYRDAERAIVPFADGTGQIYGLQNVRTLSFGNSESEPLLRASDYLLAACVDFTRRAFAGDEIPQEIWEAAHHGLGRMLTQAAGLSPGRLGLEFQVGEIMAADRWIDTVARRFLPR